MTPPTEDGWDPDVALSNLKMERSLEPSETSEDMARRILRDASATAAQAVVHIALNDPNSRVRLQAATHILDRTIGRAGEEPPREADWVQMLERAMSHAGSGNGSGNASTTGDVE